MRKRTPPLQRTPGLMLLKAFLQPPPPSARPSGLFLCLAHLVPSEVRTPSFGSLSGWICGCCPVPPAPPGSTKGTLPGLPVFSPDIRPLELMPPTCLLSSPAPHATPCPAHSLPPAPQPHIPSSSLSPSPLFLLSHGTSPWHAATAGAGELHGPQKSQAVRQSRQAARLCLANTPLMSFQKTRGRERAWLQIICFSFLLEKKKILPNETWGLGEVNYFTNLAHGSQKKAWLALQERRG